MATLWILVSSLVSLPSFYGAIAYDRQSGVYGFAYDQPSPVAAGRRVLDKCEPPGCALVLEFADGCGAYATRPERRGRRRERLHPDHGRVQCRVDVTDARIHCFGEVFPTASFARPSASTAKRVMPAGVTCHDRLDSPHQVNYIAQNLVIHEWLQ